MTPLKQQISLIPFSIEHWYSHGNFFHRGIALTFESCYSLIIRLNYMHKRLLLGFRPIIMWDKMIKQQVS